MSDRLAPTMTPDTKFFWDGAEGAAAADPALRGVRDAAPSAAADVPALPLARRGTRSSRRGAATVYSFVMPRHPPLPWFDGTYIVALVELEEGTRLVIEPRATSTRTT